MAVALISTERDISFCGNTVNTDVKISLTKPPGRTSSAASRTDKDHCMTSLIEGCDILTHALVAKWRCEMSRNRRYESANESLREEWQAHMDRAFDTVIDHSGAETGLKLRRPLVGSQISSQPRQPQAGQSMCRRLKFSSCDVPRYDKASLGELRDKATRQDQSLGLALRFSKEALDTAFSELDKYESNRTLVITYPACPGDYIEDNSGLKVGFVKSPTLCRESNTQGFTDSVDGTYMAAVVDAAVSAMEIIRLRRNYRRTLEGPDGKDDDHGRLHRKSDLTDICKTLVSQDGHAFDDCPELSYSIRPIDMTSPHASSNPALNWDDEYGQALWDDIDLVDDVVPDIIDSSNIHSLLRSMAEAERRYAYLRATTFTDGLTVPDFVDLLNRQESPEAARSAALFLCKGILKEERDSVQSMTSTTISQILGLTQNP